MSIFCKLKNKGIVKINNKKVMNIVRPPILTIGNLCIFLESGISKILNLSPRFLINGPKAYPKAAQIITLKIPIKNIFCCISDNAASLVLFDYAKLKICLESTNYY